MSRQWITSIVAQIYRGIITTMVLGVMSIVVIFTATSSVIASGPGNSSSLDGRALHTLVMLGRNTEAVALLASMAEDIGGWRPAPDDVVFFDTSLARNVRGQVWIADTMPVECDNPDLQSLNPWGDRFSQLCHNDLLHGENLVRFGAATFYNPEVDGSRTPRLNVDDMLATYIEEVGHSWQEYLYETEGLGSGPRTRSTTFEVAINQVPGREYQIKRYLLYLDGRLLDLSDEERSQHIAAICGFLGYANPLGQPFPPYGAPEGWPYPEGWPTTTPTPEEHAEFCLNG